MDNILKEIKSFKEKDEYKVLDINMIKESLDSLSIRNINISDGHLIKLEQGVVKISNTDYENPLVMEKGTFDGNTLIINPEWYLDNQELFNEILLYIVSNTKEDKISIKDKCLIDDIIIQGMCNNKNIKEVSLTKYNNDFYTLTKEHYLLFKKANIRVNTKSVSDELKDNFDDIILFNSEKYLIGYNKYKDLSEKKSLYLSNRLKDEELDYFKYINPNCEINLNNNNYNDLVKLSNKLNELGKDNVIKFKIDNKEKFNKFIFDNNFFNKNIYVETPTFDKVSLSDYLKFEKILYSMVKSIDNLSPFEKYIYIYNIVKQFKLYKENESDKKSSRYLYDILVNDYMVCVGYKNLLGDLLDKVGIKSIEMNVDVDLSYDKVKSDETEFKESIPINMGGHARRYVYLKDDKYGIDGFYISDPTWDNDLEHDYYNHMLITDRENTGAKRYFNYDGNDIFNVSNMNEYIEKMKVMLRSLGYDKFKDRVLIMFDNITKLDSVFVDALKQKYSYINENTSKWPDNISDLVYDLGSYILTKVNKNISGEIIFEGVEEIYKHSYGYSESEILDKLESVRQDNKEMQDKMFPKRYKIDEFGNKELISGEENKFNFSFDNVKKI